MYTEASGLLSVHGHEVYVLQRALNKEYTAKLCSVVPHVNAKCDVERRGLFVDEVFVSSQLVVWVNG